MFLIFGAGGFLGSYVIKHIIEDTNENVIAVTLNAQTYLSDNPRVMNVRCDLCNAEETMALVKHANEALNLKVIYLAAQHNIDVVARQPDEAYEVNITALSRVLELLENINCLFFASSDTVYGEGGDRRFKETDSLSPISIYGVQKAKGEELVLSHGYNVLRLPFMFGRSLSPYKKHFCDELIRRFSSGESADMYTDSVRSALSFDKAANIFVKLCETYSDAMPRIMNVAGDEALSKYEVGIRLAESINVDTSLVHPSESANKWAHGAERAISTLMDNSLLKRVLKVEKLTFDIV